MRTAIPCQPISLPLHAAPDDCTLFERPTQFLLADFLFKREEMSAPNINYLLDPMGF